LTYLGLFYLWQGRYDEAERWLSKALTASLESHGEKHAFTWLSRIELAMVYQEQGRYAEADRQLADVVDFVVTERDVAITTETVHIANGMHQLAVLLHKQGRYGEAEKLHLKVLGIRRSQLVENHPHTLGTMRGLIALYAAWDRPREAQKWFAALNAAYAHRSATHQYAPTIAGSVRHDPGTDTYTLTAPAARPWVIERELDFSYPESSSEMWHVCDDLHLASKRLNGDGSITARIESLSPSHYTTQVALTIRDTLASASPHASVTVTPLGDIALQHRDVELGAAHSSFAANSITLPHWIRLTRRGNLFAAHRSGDGANWVPIQDSDPNQQMSAEIPLTKTAYVGLSITSNDPSRIAEARISHVITTGDVSPPGPFTESRDIRLQLPPPK